MNRLADALRAQPEMQLLLLTAHPDPPAHFAPQVHALARAGLNWQALLSLAHRHKVVPALAHHLRPGSPLGEAVPHDARVRLETISHRLAARALRFSNALNRIMRACAEDGVAVLPVKGPALAGWLYGDVARRQFSDLDVLIHEQDLAAAFEVFAKIGYGPQAPFDLLTRDNLPRALKRFDLAHVTFAQPGGRIPLEVHWQAFVRNAMPTLAAHLLADRALQFEPRTGAWSIPPMATYILLHGARHGYRRLTWLADAAALLHRLSDDQWDDVLSLARSDGVKAATLLGPYLAHRLLSVPLPPSVEAALQPRLRHVQRLAAWCQTLSPEASPGFLTIGSSFLSHVVFEAALFDRVEDRLRYAARSSFRPTDSALRPATLASGWRGALARARAAPFLEATASGMRRSGRKRPV